MARNTALFSARNQLDSSSAASLYAGMPVGIELLDKWHIFNLNVNIVAGIEGEPGSGEEPGDGWVNTVTGTTPTYSHSVDLVPPRLIITNSASDDNGMESQYNADTEYAGESFALRAGKKLFMSCEFLMDDADSDQASVFQTNVFIGLSITDTAVLDGSTDFIGFHKPDGAGLVNMVAGKNAGASGALIDDIVTSTGVSYAAGDATLAESGLHNFALVVDGTTAISVYGDGVFASTTTSSTEIPDDENMCPTICFENGEAQAKILHITKFIIAMER